MSNQEPSIADLELLTAGSVWTREDGREARFLFITNQALTGKAAIKFPSVVVYADDKDNVLSVPLEQFLANRTYHHIEPSLEQRIGNLLAYSGESSDDDFTLEDGDELVVSEGAPDDAAESVDFNDVDDMDDPDSDSRLAIEFYPSNPEAAAPIDIALLSASVECYEQAPILEKDLLQHTLFIHAAPGINRDTLYKAFTPSDPTGAFLLFKVKTADGVANIDWDNFLGIYPYNMGSQLLYKVVFTSTHEFSVSAAVPEAEEVVAAVAPEAPVVEAAAPALVVVGEAPAAVVTPAPTPVPAVASTLPVA